MANAWQDFADRLFHSFSRVALAVTVGLAVFLCAVAALPTRRKVTPQQWARELERHLLGKEGEWEWDDATSISLADERLLPPHPRVRFA